MHVKERFRPFDRLEGQTMDEKLVVDATRAPIDPARKRLIGRLRELIDALDSRVPHLEREGEMRIADEAAALRKKAVERISELEK
jgi:hypothetical protein